MSKHHLLLLGGAAIAAYLYKKHSDGQQAEAAAAAAVHHARRGMVPTTAMPTDSLMPGVMPAAVQGMVVDFKRQSDVAQMQGY